MVYKIGKPGPTGGLLVRPEWQEQAAVVAWARLNEYRWPGLKWLQGSINGVRLSPGVRGKVRAQGLKPGFPDLFLPVVLGGFCGWFCELKRRKGYRVSIEQKEFIAYLNDQGYRAVVAAGSDAAIAGLLEYLNPPAAKWED